MVVIWGVLWLAAFVIAAAVGFVAFMLMWSAGVLLLRIRRRAIAMVIGVPVYVGLLVVAVVALLMYQPAPADVFESCFGFEPTPDVVMIGSSVDGFGDWMEAHLAFEADRATVDRIVALGYQPKPADVYVEGPGPRWWAPPDTPGVERYYTGALNSGYGFSTGESHLLIYDPSTQTVWYQFSGID